MSDSPPAAWLSLPRLAAVVIAAGLLAALVAYTVEVLCLIFAGVVIGVFFAETGGRLAGWLHVPRLVALLALLSVFLAAVVGLSLWLVPSVVAQMESLVEAFPGYLELFRERLGGTHVGQESLAAAERALGRVDGVDGGAGLRDQASELLGHAAGVFASGVGALGAAVVVLAIALHVGFEPGLYRRGLISLAPERMQGRVEQTLDRVGTVIAWWFVGQMISMLVLGTAMSVGLWLIDIPFPLVFGLLAALMTFVPNLGPILAAVPALLVALTLGLAPTVYVLILVTVLQNVEGLLLTPLVHRRLVALPPAVVLASLLLLGSVAGLIGAVVAMPLVATVVAAVRVWVIEPRAAATGAGSS